ncbi:MAG: phospholipase D family protein, partial [bacterium]
MKEARFSPAGRIAAGLLLLGVFLFPACKNTPSPIIDTQYPNQLGPPDFNQTATLYLGANYTVQFVDPAFGAPIESPTSVNDFGLLLDQIKVNFPARVKSQYNLRTVIDGARISLDIATPEINDQEIVDALVRAVLRGVQVRVVTEHFYRISDGSPLFNINGVPHFDKPFYDQLEAGGIVLVDDGDNLSRQMHSRYVIVDGKTVIFSTGTLTARTYFFSNTIIITFNSTLVASYFQRDFANMLGGKFGSSKPISDSQVTGIHIGNSAVDLYFGPAGGLLKTVIADDVLGRATSAVAFANYDFTDSFIGDRINTLINSGVFVTGVWDGVQAVAEGQGSQYFRADFIPLQYPDHTTAFNALAAFGPSGFAADFGAQPPFSIRFMNLKYIATDPTSFTLDPEVALMS